MSAETNDSGAQTPETKDELSHTTVRLRSGRLGDVLLDVSDDQVIISTELDGVSVSVAVDPGELDPKSARDALAETAVELEHLLAINRGDII